MRCNTFAVHLISYYFPYYIGGYVVARFKLLNRIVNPALLSACGVLFIVAVPYWTWKGDVLFMGMVYFPGITSQFYRMLVGWAAIVFFFGMFSLGGSYSSRLPSLMTYWGRETLGIYALHYLGLALGLRFCSSFSFPFEVASISIVALVFSHVLIILIKKSKWASFLLLGTVGRKIL